MEHLRVIAVSAGQHARWGCPYCGYPGYEVLDTNRDTTVADCSGCECHYAIVLDGVEQSSIGFGVYYPPVERHPLRP